MEKHQEFVCPPAAFSPTPTGEENGFFLGSSFPTKIKNNPRNIFLVPIKIPAFPRKKLTPCVF